jgi:5'-3' exonuclease
MKFRDKYGDMVIACDGGSWRRDYFPEYKFKRRESRESDDQKKAEFDMIFEILNKIRDELMNDFHWKVVYERGVEADDIIAVLVEETQEFGKHEDVMIVSADKDFIQLQKYNNVRQWSPMTKKFVQEKDPNHYLIEHIFRGDGSDGIPNILSPDNTFVEGIRQKPVTKKKIEAWLQADNLESALTQEEYRNYIRNKKLIDLSEIPEDIKDKILTSYENAHVAPKNGLLNFFIKKKLRNLIDCLGDFY